MVVIGVLSRVFKIFSTNRSGWRTFPSTISNERNSSFGLAFLRMDGFVGLTNFKENEYGLIQTFENAINITHKYLTVTVDTLSLNSSSSNFVKVGIIFGNSNDTNQYNLNQSIPISKNVTDYVVQWNNNKSDLTQFIGQLVTIQFELYNAVLYTFDFVN